jgi:hypothetical protein
MNHLSVAVVMSMLFAVSSGADSARLFNDFDEARRVCSNYVPLSSREL